jgi:hypothetical protein
MEQYRCHKVWAIKTRQVRIVNQLVWFPPQAFPKLTSADLLRATLEDMKTILMNPPTDTYVGHLEQTQRGVLINLQNILNSNLQLNDNNTTPDASLLGVPPGTPKPLPRQTTRTSQPIARYQPVFMAVNPNTGRLSEYTELKNSSEEERWKIAFCKEWGRLFQGYKSTTGDHDTEGTQT